MINFPEDLLLEILSWLPGKSLMRFKSVSKHWFYLITSSFFGKSYLSRSRSHSHSRFRGGGLVVIHRTHNFNPRIFIIDSKREPIDRVTFHTPSPPFVYYGKTNIVDGLICFYFNNHLHNVTFMCLYNITTREILPLPCPPLRDAVRHSAITLWFDPIHGQYKLIHMYRCMELKVSLVGCEVHTIFGGKDAWRNINTDKIRKHHGIVNILNLTILENKIVLNIELEKFENSEFPIEYERKYFDVSTCHIGGYLSVVAYEFRTHKVHLWRQIGRNNAGKLLWANEIIKCPLDKYSREWIRCSDSGLMSNVMSYEFETGFVNVEYFDLTTREHTRLKLYNVKSVFGTSRFDFDFKPSLLVENITVLNNNNNNNKNKVEGC